MMLARACTFRPAVAAMRPMAAARPLACAPRAACYIKPSTRLMSSAGFDENKYDEHGQVRVAENSRVFIDVSIAGGEPQRMTFEVRLPLLLWPGLLAHSATQPLILITTLPSGFL